MSIDPFIGEVILFGGNFAPQGWAFCHGQLLSISQNTALFSLLGTTYGGDGQTTFALPDLRGRAPIGAGQGPGLNNRMLGSSGGEETHTLQVNELPPHDHAIQLELFASSSPAHRRSPDGAALAATNGEAVYSEPSNLSPMSDDALDGTVANTGQGQAHNNMSPYLALNYIIALQGIYPSRP
jgi:microcystin-dependent protein